MQTRLLGKTGVSLSVVGFGGIIVMDENPAQAANFVSRAVDAGVNYFDVAPSYGNAEEKLGPALAPHRKNAFLACKSAQREGKASRKELENSLKLLQTDHLDLYQLHAMTSKEDLDSVFGPGGAMETLVRAKKEGLTRFLGFSAHSEHAALTLMERYDFDSLLFPCNNVTWNRGKFGPRVLEMAKSKGMGLLALKALAKRPWREGETKKWPKCWYSPVESYEEALAGLSFTLGLGVTAAVSPGHWELFDWALQAEKDIAAGKAPKVLAVPQEAPIFSAVH